MHGHWADAKASAVSLAVAAAWQSNIDSRLKLGPACERQSHGKGATTSRAMGFRVYRGFVRQLRPSIQP